jgi:Tol biopolymer transport system component
VGWLPDNRTIVFGAQNGDIHALYQHTFKTYNLQSGETKSLFQVNIKTAMGSISADGQWIAFNENVFGANPDGAVFVARLDGSERKMVAELDDAYPFHPLWGPVGPTGEQWLIVNIFNPNKAPSPALVNPFSCQAVPLNGLQGEIQSWAP